MSEVIKENRDTLTSEKTPSYAWVILAVVYFASVVAPLGMFKIPPLASWIIPAYEMSLTTFGWLMSLVSLIGVILAFPAAFICRRVGLKTTILIALGCMIAGGIIEASTSSITPMIIGRLFEGAGIGLVGVAAPTCVSIWFPAKTRGLALGVWATWMPVATVLIFNTAPMIALASDWRVVFWIVTALCAVAFILFALLFKLPEGKTADYGVEGSFKESFKYIKNVKIWLLGATFFIFSVVALGIVSTYYNTFLMTSVWQMSEQAAASLTSVTTAIGIIAIPIAGALSDRMKPERKWILIAVAYVLMLIGMLFAWSETSFAMIWTFVIIIGIANGFAGGASRPLAPFVMGGTVMGTTMGMAILQFCQNLGGAVGSPIFGSIYESTNLGWFGTSGVVAIPLLALAIVLAFFIKPGKKNAADQEKGEENVPW